MTATLAVAILRPEVGTWVREELPYPKGDTAEARKVRLKSLQGVVGGLIQLVPLETEAVTLFCNEEGKLLDLPASAFWIYEGRAVDTLCGALVAAGPSDDEGELTPITEEGLEALKREARAIPAGMSGVIPIPKPRVAVAAWDI